MANGDGSGVGDKRIAASGEAAEESADLSVGVAIRTTTPMPDDSTEMSACPAGVAWTPDPKLWETLLGPNW